MIDELLPLHDVKVLAKLPERVKSVTCVPNGEKLAFEQKDDSIEFVLPKLECHQMIELKLHETLNRNASV